MEHFGLIAFIKTLNCDYDERLRIYTELKYHPDAVSYINKLKEDDLSDDYFNYVLECLPYENWNYRPTKRSILENIGIMNYLHFTYHHSMYSQEERLLAWIGVMATDTGKKNEADFIATLDSEAATIYLCKNKVYADRASVYLIKSCL